MMHQEENINKCLPPSTFTTPTPLPLLQKPTASHVRLGHILEAGTSFGIKLLNTLLNKVYFLIVSFHICILHLCIFVLELGTASAIRRCPVAVKFMSRSLVENQNHTAWKRVVLSTHKAKQTVWHLSFGRCADGSSGFSVFLPDAFNASYSVFLLSVLFSSYSLCLVCVCFKNVPIPELPHRKHTHTRLYSNRIPISNVKWYCHNGHFLQNPNLHPPPTRPTSLSLSGWANTDITTIRGVVFKTLPPLWRNSIYCLMWTDRLSSKAAKYFV